MSVDDQSQQHAQTQTTLGNVTGAVLSGEFHGQVNVNAPPAPSVAAVRSIPAPPRDFTGRADDLRTLLAAFERGATITGVRGLGGIGKTALAYKLAESLASRYPDGNVFIPLYGVRPQPVAPDDAMKTVLRAVLGEEARLPEGGDALGNRYRSALHGKRLLLLFDDAKDRAACRAAAAARVLRRVNHLAPEIRAARLAAARFGRAAAGGCAGAAAGNLPANRRVSGRISPRVRLFAAGAARRRKRVGGAD